MPTQKGKEVTRARQEVVRENRLSQFWRDTRGELRKVVWPNREQAMNWTMIVVVVVAGMSAFLGAIDFVLSALVRLILVR